MSLGYFNTYSEYKTAQSSEKALLAIVEASKRLMGWVLHSGSVYKLTSFDFAKIVSIEDSGTALTEVSSLASVSAGKYYNDRTNQVLYLETSDSANPNSKFLGMTFRFYFSNIGIALPHDLSSGFEVFWEPLLKDTSAVGPELDNQNQLGFAIEGSGSVKFLNDQSFWKPKFDKLTFENQRVLIYSWHRSLPPSEAKLLFKGRIEKKSYTTSEVTFQVKDLLAELKQPISLDTMESVSGARLKDGQNEIKQRRIYGEIHGIKTINIDQVLDTGYPLTGTVSVTSASATVTGSSTTFLTELLPGDQIFINGEEEAYAIESIASDTSLTLSEEWAFLTTSGASATVLPERPKRYINREHFIAGHALKEPQATIVGVKNFLTITVDDDTDFRVGDEILVPTSAGNEITNILRLSNNIIRFSTSLLGSPTIGGTVKKTSVFDVYLNNKELLYERDYTYDADEGTITLTNSAEENNSPVLSVVGTSITLTSSSRAVTGVGTIFDAQLIPGDLIRVKGQSDFFRVLSIESATALTLAEASTYTATAAGQYKSPKYFDDAEDILSVSALGITDDGTKTGTFPSTAAQVVKHILTDIGLSSDLNSSSFTTASEISEARVGLVIPESFGGKNEDKVRNIIDKINRSVFGSLIQNGSFQLEYNILSPKRNPSVSSFDEADVVSFSVQADGSDIIKTAIIEYDVQEYHGPTGDEKISVIEKTSNEAQYLAKTNNEFRSRTVLINQTDAQILANRWSFIFARASTVVKFKTKLQAIDLDINDKVLFKHSKIYERDGTSLERKVAAVQKVKKTALDVEVEIEDLHNTFSRCGTITEDDSNDYANASNEELVINGFITDTYGMQDNDSETLNHSIIW